MADEFIDGIPIDRGPSAGSQAAPADSQATPATEGESGTDSDKGDEAAPTAATSTTDKKANDSEDAKGSDAETSTASDDTSGEDSGESDDVVYSPETVKAQIEAARAEGERAAEERIRNQTRDESRAKVKTRAKDSFPAAARSYREMLTNQYGITDPAEQNRLMAPWLTHNNGIEDAAFDVANAEYESEYAIVLADDADGFFEDIPENSPARVALTKLVEVKALKSKAFVNAKPEALMEAHKPLKAHVLKTIEDGIRDGVKKEIDEYKRNNRPAFQPVGDEKMPAGNLGLATYTQKLRNGESLPSSSEIDAMTKQWAESLS